MLPSRTSLLLLLPLTTAALTGCPSATVGTDPTGTETDCVGDCSLSLPGGLTDDDDDGTTSDPSGSDTDADTGSDTDSDSDAGTDSDSDTDGCPALCGCVPEIPRPEPPAIMLVLDKSGSMVSTLWDHDGDDADDDGEQDDAPGEAATPRITRWSSLHSVVSEVAVGLGDRLNLGAQLFPSMDAQGNNWSNACVVEASPEVPVAHDNAATLLDTIPGADALDLQGGTPAERGVASAADHLVSLDAAAYPGRKYMLLITDGGANCSVDVPEDQPGELVLADPNLELTVAQALAGWGDDAVSISTMVVGIDILDAHDDQLGANPFELLNDVAAAGGHGRDGDERFYNTTNQDELLTAIDGLIGALSCTIPLGEDGQPDFTALHVDVDGEGYEQIEDCEADDGWIYADEDRTAIVLCGQACDDFLAGGAFEGAFSCISR